MQWAFLRAAGRTETGCRLQLEPTGQPVTAAPSTEAEIRVAFKAKHQAIPLPLRGRWDCCLHRQTLYVLGNLGNRELFNEAKPRGHVRMYIHLDRATYLVAGYAQCLVAMVPPPRHLGKGKARARRAWAVILRSFSATKQPSCNPIRVCAALLVAVPEFPA